MQTSLNQAYPAPRPGLRSITISVLFGLFIGLFLWFFEPFDINLYLYENGELLFFGLISSAVLLVFLHLLPLWFSKIFADQHWKVKHQILFYILILFVIATLNGLYTNYINELPFSWGNYWWIINRTFALGGIPITFITLVDSQRKTIANSSQALEILQVKTTFGPEQDTQSYPISTDLKNESFHLEVHLFYYAAAVGNYIDLYLLEDKMLKRTTYRLTLSSFEAQLKSSGLVRCHRSYVVNLKKVKNITGNAQGLKLELENQAESIPVSRKYLPAVKAFFQNNSLSPT